MFYILLCSEPVKDCKPSCACLLMCCVQFKSLIFALHLVLSILHTNDFLCMLCHILEDQLVLIL